MHREPLTIDVEAIIELKDLVGELTTLTADWLERSKDAVENYLIEFET